MPGDVPIGGAPSAAPLGTASTTQAIVMGDSLPIRHFSNKPIRQIILSREGILEVKPYVQDNRQLPNLFVGKGIAIGVTTVTVEVDGEQPDTFTVRVDANLDYIRNLVATQFPTANVKITAGPTQGTYIITGWVESPEQVEPLRNFVMGFVPQSGTGVAREQAVTMAVTVAGVQQVQLEVCVARVVRGNNRNMGFSFAHSDSQNFFGNALGSLATLAQTASFPGRTVPTVNGLAASASLLPSPGGNIQFGLTSDSAAFMGVLQALRQESLSKILANPTIVTMSGRQAEFVVGGEAPAVAAGVGGGGDASGGGGGGGAIQFRSFGTIVRFLPVVLGGGRIRVQVQAEVSRPAGVVTQATFTAPNFEVTTVQSTVEMENRQTLVIGGLLQTELDATTLKVPILGDLPFLGAAFRQVAHEETETELIVLVTPSLVESMDPSQRPARVAGHETRSPTDFELFLEGIMEAPRGPRDPFPGRRYVPAYKLSEPFGNPMGEGCDNGACGTGWSSTRGGHGCSPCATGTGPVVIQASQMQSVQVVPVSAPAPMPAPMPVPVAAPVAPMAPVAPVAPATMRVPNSRAVILPPATPAAPEVQPVSAPAPAETPKEVQPSVPPLPPSDAPASDIPDLPKGE
ncbi:MAG TPA: hypothetical protein PKD86_09800 [Gemmatales bacterium]|nr:hypothetical protein [Gemmatales bacterium]HMP59635.1 hypothetical protein [Gemmatales bacterium]